MTTGAPLKVGTVLVWPASNELDAGRGRERIAPRLMALLIRLVTADGAPVDRTTLIDEVWSRKGVTDEVLSRAIAELRTLLGDDAKAPRYIETLPKVGYRLIAAIAPLDEPSLTRTAVPRAPKAGMAGGVLAAAVLATGLAGWALRDAADPAAVLQRQFAAATVLAGGADIEVAPRFSADGRRIVYAVGRESSRIVVEDRATRARSFVGPEGGLQASPVFRPDGNGVVFLRVVGDDCTIVEADAGGWRERLRCPAGMRQRFDLAPDGRRIVASAQRRPDRPHALLEIDLAGGETRWLTDPAPGEGEDTLPRYAPDGTSIAFFRGNDSRRELWLLAREAPAAARRVSPQSGLAYGSAFLPGADALLVSADWVGFRALLRVDLANGAHALVGARGARFPDVAANGDVVYELATYRANLWRVDSSGSRPPAEAWPAARYTNQPEVSPDGTRVAFVSNRDGVEALYVAAIDGEARRVPGGDEWRTTRPRWSSDGRDLYAVRTRRGEPASASIAVRIDPGSGASTPLPALGDHVHDVTPAADGRTLYVGELAGHAIRLARVSSVDGATERLPLPLVSEFRISGDLLAYAQPQLTGLTVCTLPALACRPLAIPVDDATRFDWTLAPDALWVRVGVGETAQLARYDPANGRETLRLPLGPTAAGTNIAAGRGGVPLLVAREAPVEIDVMIAPR